MKTVFKPDMVAHLWANQSQFEARNAGKTFYFHDENIFSYGSHFMIAKIVKNKRGERAVLFTRRDYSPTTAKHKSMTLRAIPPGVPIFYVPDPGRFYGDDKHKEMLSFYVEEVKKSLVSAARARRASNKSWHIERAQIEAAQQAEYIRFFGLRNKPVTVPADALERLPELLKQAEAEQARRDAAANRAEAARLEKARAAAAERREKWLAGLPGVQLHGSEFAGVVKLRVFGDQVETSKGAQVPVEHAKRLWKVIERVRERGEPYVKNGHSEHVGHFVVDRIETTGDITVGCHQINYDELRRIAGELGLVDPADSFFASRMAEDAKHCVTYRNEE